MTKLDSYRGKNWKLKGRIQLKSDFSEKVCIPFHLKDLNFLPLEINELESCLEILNRLCIVATI